MASLLYQMFTSFTLMSLSLYHLIFSTRSHIKSPSSYTSKPYYPLPIPIHNNSNNNLVNKLKKHLPIYLTSSCLLISIINHSFLGNSSPDPLFRGGSSSHHLISLQTSLSLLLFLLISLSFLLLPSFPCPLTFALSSAAFASLSLSSSSSSSLHASVLPSKLSSTSSLISAASSALSASLAFFPTFYPLDVALSASLSLQSLWSLQTGLTLHVDSFVPDGCHRLLDLPSDSPTTCDLPDSQRRASSLLDLAFLFHVLFVSVLVLVVYASVARSVSSPPRRGGLTSYQPLPNSSSPSTASAAAAAAAAAAASSSASVVIDSNHVQLKTMTNTQE